YLEKKGNDPEIARIIQSHSQFIFKLKQENDTSFKTVGNQLFTLKKNREKADYKIKENVDKKLAEISYSQAIRIRTKVDSIL
ncbi:hypothetical protein KA005_68925, partial [bacterium]|nr:hypothetical protein [bacterium]